MRSQKMASFFTMALPLLALSAPMHLGWTSSRNSGTLFASPFRSLKNGVHRTSQRVRDSRELRRDRRMANVDDEEDFDFINDPKVLGHQLIKVSSQVELPFSAEVAYDAYSNLPRQPTWSSWLDTVVLSTDNPEESRWTMKFMGIKYSWTAVAVKNERPHTIQWRSITGLRNYGTVRFSKYSGSGTSTLMTMRMTFVAPRAVSTLFRKSQKLANFVETTMITQSLHGFRDVVLEVDLKKEQES